MKIESYPCNQRACFLSQNCLSLLGPLGYKAVCIPTELRSTSLLQLLTADKVSTSFT